MNNELKNLRKINLNRNNLQFYPNNINKGPGNPQGKSKMFVRNNPFDKLAKIEGREAKQIMNKSGQNIIHNEMRGINNFSKD